MRKIIFMILASLDGRVSDENGGLDWIAYDAELENYAHSLHATTDAAIYGRMTYGTDERLLAYCGEQPWQYAG